jgi:hypothetical protein
MSAFFSSSFCVSFSHGVPASASALAGLLRPCSASAPAARRPAPVLRASASALACTCGSLRPCALAARPVPRLHLRRPHPRATAGSRGAPSRPAPAAHPAPHRHAPAAAPSSASPRVGASWSSWRSSTTAPAPADLLRPSALHRVVLTCRDDGRALRPRRPSPAPLRIGGPAATATSPADFDPSVRFAFSWPFGHPAQHGSDPTRPARLGPAQWVPLLNYAVLGLCTDQGVGLDTAWKVCLAISNGASRAFSTLCNVQRRFCSLLLRQRFLNGPLK